MPKPFKRRPDQKVILGPSAVLVRPLLAIDIANVASHWSKLEQTLALPFTLLLAGQEPSAFEAYHELFETNLRHKMFLAAARRKRLPRELTDESIALHAKVRKAAAQRNNVVHGTWAFCDDFKESLLLCDPSAVDRRVDEFFSNLHDQLDGFEAGKQGSWSFDLSVDDYQEYRHSDFEEIVKRIIELDGFAFSYMQKIAAFSLQHERERRSQRGRR